MVFLLVLQAFIALALIGVILLQKSEGGGLGLGGGQRPHRRHRLKRPREGNMLGFVVGNDNNTAFAEHPPQRSAEPFAQRGGRIF